MTALLFGESVARPILDYITEHMPAFVAKTGKGPQLNVLLVGDNPASHTYVAIKTKQAKSMGMDPHVLRWPSMTPTAVIIDKIHAWNRDPNVHGILVQLPLPKSIDTKAILAAIDPQKDVDGLTPINVGNIYHHPLMIPCTPRGCMMMIRSVVPDLAGCHAVVIGRSAIVGRPMAQLLLRADCTVTQIHSHSRHAKDLTRLGDIVIVAAGSPHLVDRDWIKEGAVVIDVGLSTITTPEGKKIIRGDVKTADLIGWAKSITPVPRGVGPVTVACLLLNTFETACRAEGLHVEPFHDKR